MTERNQPSFDEYHGINISINMKLYSVALVLHYELQHPRYSVIDVGIRVRMSKKISKG